MEKSFEQLGWFQGVEGQTSGPLDQGKQADAADISAELHAAREEMEKYKRRAQGLVGKNRFNFELFAESAAPRFVFSDAFRMEYKKKEVHMATDWFYKREFSDEQILWATYHELAHFYDFADNYRAILGRFESIEHSARATGARLAEKYRDTVGQSHPEEMEKWLEQKMMDEKTPERGTMNAFERIGYGIHHEFWNIMDDVYVNSLVVKRKPIYSESGKYGGEVRRLYSQQLFKEFDFSNLPRHKQFMYALLRCEMVPDEKTTVRPEIEEALNKKHIVFGKEYSAGELLAEFIKAKNTLGQKAGKRYFYLEKTLAPIFEELLLKDIEDWQPEAPKEEEDMAGQQAQQDQDVVDKHSVDQGSKQDHGASSEQKGEDEGDDQGQGGEKQGQEGGQRGDKEGVEKGEPSTGQGGRDGRAQDQQGSNTETAEGAPGNDSQNRGKPESEVEGKQAPKTIGETIDDAFNPAKEGKPGGAGGDSPVIPRPVQSPEDIKNIVDQFKQGQEDWRARPAKENEIKPEETAKEREKRLKELRDQQWCEQYKVDYETIQRYQKTERMIKPYLAALDSLWQRIIYGYTKEITVQAAGHYQEGEEFDVDEAVREFPKILAAELDKVRVMTRSEDQRELVHRPDLIRVRFIGDASGSMNDERRAILEQAFVLIFSSLRRFETYLNLTRGRTKSKLSVDTEGWVFGSTAEKKKSFRRRGSYNKEKAAIVNMFGGLREDEGGTRDDRALEAIDESLTAADSRKIKSKKMMELVFEVTDGGTNEEGIYSAKKAIAGLEQKGVIVRAFQIGTTDESEQDVFNSVWNTDLDGRSSRERRGQIVGADIKNLIPALTRALAKHLAQVKL